MTADMNQGLLNIREAARYLGISHHTLYKLLERRDVPAAKIGGSWRFNRATLDDFVASQSVVPRPRVVIIDPVKPERERLADMVSARAGRIEGVATADEAVRLLGRDRPDLIFLSLASAGAVAESLNHLREEGIDSRVVLVLSPADAQQASPALEHGPVFLIPKPLEQEDVISILSLITH